MRVTISKNIRIQNPNKDIIEYCKNVLIIPNPDYTQAQRMGRYLGNIEKELLLYSKVGDELILPFGTLRDIWGYMIGCDYETQFNAFKGNNLIGNIKLYDYQENALNALKNAKNGVLQAPCGSGKTNIGLQLIKSVGGRALWLTHTKKLLEQSYERAKTYFTGDFGKITDGKVSIGKDITFATVQTMCKVDPSIYENAFDMVVVDEVHRCVGSPTQAKMFYKVVSNINARYKYGLSATLSRSDGMIQSVYALIGNKVYIITEQEVGDKIIKAKHICVEITTPYRVLDYSGSDGTIDFNKLITTLVVNNARNNIIVANCLHYFTLGKKQLILCHRVEHVKTLATMLKDKLRVSAIYGSVKQKDRQYDADVIIATYALAKEGLDIPDLDVAHFATPQKDRTIVKQSAGRVERNIQGKAQPLIIDYVDINIPYCVRAYTQRKRILKK